MAVVAQRDGVRVIAFQKCGHTSIINMFLTAPGDEVVRGAKPAVLLSGPDYPPPAKVYKGSSAHDWPKADITIAFFRHPLQRTYSTYEHFIIRTLVHPLISAPSLGRKQFTELGFKANMSIEDFCEHLTTIDLDYDKHLKPQATSFNELRTDNVWMGRLENLNEQWPLLVESLRLPCAKEVAHFNAASYESYQPGPHVQIIEDLYAEDYELWHNASDEARTQISPVRHQAS